MPKSTDLPLSQPLTFEPIFMERIWGGRRLESLYGKRLPVAARIGESWEIVDRPEAQSIVAAGPWRGRTLHELWVECREQVFGCSLAQSERFPLLIKLLDAREKLSLQVHPPADVAAELGGEPKTEFWYIAEADPGAELYAGLKRHSSRTMVENALASGTFEELVHRIAVRAGDAMFLPSGRIHALGAGIVLVEIQQNSDTTYRVFDWNRAGPDGARRELHIEESLRSIAYDDCQPGLLEREAESLVRNELFDIEKWELASARVVSPKGSFAIVACLAGELACTRVRLRPGEFFLVPASLEARELEPLLPNTSLLRVTIPS